MDIRFTSSLTPEDESRLARTISTVLGVWLDHLPILYRLHITTSDGEVLTRTSGRPPIDASQPHSDLRS
jgi:hypothetical protein